ncbi:MAG: electron transporter SenC [Acidobacteria bacterium]|nr:MAG: electron transporter SenC [Acidobacteriota bacterium]
MPNHRRWFVALAAAVLLIAGAVLLREARATATSRAGEEAGAGAQSATASDKSKGGSVWGANYFPNVPLVTHEGKTVRFFDDLIKDKVVAINFIYTTCPDACPMETARLLEVQQLLGEERMGKDVFFYSISIDPEHDTPEVLNKFVKDWQIGPGWTFLTGREEDIIQLRKKFGVYIEEIQGPDSRDHNLSLVIGNQSTGRWMKRSPFENAYVLAKQIGGELHNWKIASTVKRDYAKAPELRNDVSKGETLFRTRCEACHTIGGGDVVQLNARRIGPDLYKVTERRDRAWLERWLKAPDEMLAEKDPLAMALYARYNNVPMPNMQLNDVETQAILEHIEKESARVEKHVKMGHRRDPMAAIQAAAGAVVQQDHGGQQDHGDHHDHGDHAMHHD